MGVSTNMPRHPLTLVTPQATPSCRGTHPPSPVEESTSCVCISMSLSNPNHTTQVCLKNTPIFQTIDKLMTITTGSFELIGHRPAYQYAILACTRVCHILGPILKSSNLPLRVSNMPTPLVYNESHR